MRIARYSTLLYVRVFFFFAFRPNVPLVLGDICGRIGNEMPRKEKILVTKRWVQLDNKNGGDAHPHWTSRVAGRWTQLRLEALVAISRKTMRPQHRRRGRRGRREGLSHLLPCLAPLEPARPSARRSRPPLACITPSGDLRCGGLAPVTFWLTPAPNCPCTRICGCMLTGASTNLSMTWICGAPPHNAVDELDMWRAPCLVHPLDHGSLSWHRNRHIHDRRVMNSIERLNLRNFDCLLGCRDEHFGVATQLAHPQSAVALVHLGPTCPEAPERPPNVGPNSPPLWSHPKSGTLAHR